MGSNSQRLDPVDFGGDVSFVAVEFTWEQQSLNTFSTTALAGVGVGGFGDATMTETYKVGSLVVDLFGANQPKHGQPESKL
jgi:hypothetical protein